MELSGHSGEVFCAKFDPNGNYIASGSMDRSICEWNSCCGGVLWGNTRRGLFLEENNV